MQPVPAPLRGTALEGVQVDFAHEAAPMGDTQTGVFQSVIGYCKWGQKGLDKAYRIFFIMGYSFQRVRAVSSFLEPL